MGTEEVNREEKLFDEFPPVSKEEWEEIIKRDLQGADYKEKLKWETGEGIEVLPFYRKEDLQDLDIARPIKASKEKKNAWKICQPIFKQEVSGANEEAKSVLERGAEALRFELNVLRTEGSLGGDLKGTAIQNQEDFSTLLSGIDLEEVTLNFNAGMASPVLLAMLQNEMKSRSTGRHKASGSFLYDPYAYTARKGQTPKPESDFLDEAVQMAAFCNNHMQGFRCLGIDTRTWHNSGATIIEELGLGLATGSEYLAKLSDRGLVPGEIASNIHFVFSIGSNYFLEIAKLRAVRLLWNKILNAYGLDPESPNEPYIQGETSQWNKSIYDPYTNMLRTTTEGMAAAIAGCDIITVNPFNMCYQEPENFGQRMARNTQVIFKEEAYLDQVYDPAAGSYYIEKLTDEIAGAAWKLFQDIEKQGGMFKAIIQGSVAQMIESSARKRNRAIARRGRIFVGVNQYPNPDGRKADQLDAGSKTVSLKKSDNDLDLDVDRDHLIDSLAENIDIGAQLGDIIPLLFEPGKQLFRAVEPYRGTEPFEELRLATERHSSTPKVLMLPIGNRKMRKARSSFAVNFFGCAGYEIEDPIGFENVEEAIAEIKKLQPEIAVLCSSDEEYDKLVEDTCKRIESLEQKPLLVLAGYPENKLDRYREAGIDAFIHRKSNVLETLEEFHHKLGISLNKK